MAWEDFGWNEMPGELAPRQGESLYDWTLRVRTYDAAHPGVLTEVESARLEEFGEHIYNAAIADAPGGGAVVDASTTVKGVSKLSHTPASEPIAAGANHPALTDTRTPTDATVTAAKVAAALKPSGSAVAGTEALRALGTAAGQALPGDHASVTNARTPTAHTHGVADLTPGTPASGKYFDGAAGWTTLPAGSGSGLPSNFRTISSSATAAANDFMRVDASAGAVPITIPTGSAGNLITVQKTDASGNFVTADVASGGTINGDATGVQIQEQHGGVILECVSSGVWLITASLMDFAGGVTQVDFDAHLTDTTDAHDASAISYQGGTGTGATDVEGALDELSIEKLNAAEKGAASGVAPLNSSSRVPVANLASGTPDGTKFIRDDGALAVPAGGSSVYIPSRFRTPEYMPGAVVQTDFSNQDRDSQLFTIANLTYGTDAGDSGRAVVTPTAIDGTLTTVLTKQNFRDFDIRIRYRSGASPHSSTETFAVARYLSENNHARLSKPWGSAGLSTTERINGSSTSVKSDATVDTDITTSAIRYLRFRAIGPLLLAKGWLASTSEPDWQIIAARPNSFSGGAPWADFGAGGFRGKFFTSGFMLSEVTVTELRKSSDSMIFNGDGRLVDQNQSSRPAAWYNGTPLRSGGTADRATVTDQNGVSRPVFHCQGSADASGEVSWRQDLFSALHSRDTNWQPGGHQFPHFVDDMPRAVEVGLWTKGTSLVHLGAQTFLGAAVVLYHADEAGTGLQSGAYYSGVGTNQGSGAAAGTGTWGWQYDRVVIPFTSPQRVSKIALFIGLHDIDVGGDFWFTDVSVRPVA